MNRIAIAAISTLILFASILTGAQALGAQAVVTNTNNGLVGSLRQIIQDANPGDTVVFNIPTSDPGYDSATGVFTITLTGGELMIGKNLTIDGAAAKIVVQRSQAGGTPQFRIFNITSGTISISNLSISFGNVDNSAPYQGGGIRNAGSLTVRNCLILGNAAGNGGGIYNAAGGALTVTNTTLFQNLSQSGVGGAIYNAGALSVDNSTVARNGVNNGCAGGIDNDTGGTAHVRNTIVAQNDHSGTLSNCNDVSGIFVSDGYNFIGNVDGSSGFGASGSHDQVGSNAAPADPQLGPLQDNGGLTETLAPLLGSPVIDQGLRGTDANNAPINTDQRGKPRPIDQPSVPNAGGGDASDIGAVELGLLQSGPAFTVTNTSEHDGACTNDDCSLREAINAANANAGSNTVNFASGLSGVILNTIASGGLNITNPLTINGPGARTLTISGNNASRILNVAVGVTATVSGLTIANGNSVSIGTGGGISNSGTLTLLNCAVLNNSGGSGGGAVNVGTLTVTNCTFAGNQSTGHGGALRNVGSMTVTNSTFNNNTAVSSGAITSFVNSGPAASVTLTNCTISGNTASDTSGGVGGGLFNGNLSTMTVRNTIISGNTAPNGTDVSGSFVSQGYNLIGSVVGSTGFGATGDQTGGSANANLDTLKNNGGATDTLALLNGSTAINAGNDANAPPQDQRYYLRSGVSDIGAFEFGGVLAPVRVVSRKTHGSAGVFDINLPLTGTRGVECRTGGVTQVVFTFPSAVTINTTAGTQGAMVTSGTGSVTSTSGSSTTGTPVVSVNLTGVSDIQYITLSLLGVNDGTHTNDVALRIGVLLGDVNASGIVTSGDTNLCKAAALQPVTNANFRNDINASGAITTGDVNLIKQNALHSLPSPP